MSFMVDVKVPIKDVALFKRLCSKHDLRFQEVNSQNTIAELHDMSPEAEKFPRRTAYLMTGTDGAYLRVDNDRSYCSISHRLGVNAGKLMQGYTVASFRKMASKKALTIKQSTRRDGCVVLKLHA